MVRSMVRTSVASILTLVWIGCSVDASGKPVPVAVVNADRVERIDRPISLDGTESYVPGRSGATLEYRWELVSSPAADSATLTNATRDQATLQAAAPGLYVTRLVVTFDGVDSAPAYSNLRAFELNLPPIASAGPDQSVTPALLVTLDGSGSADPNGDSLTFAWRQSQGTIVILAGQDTQNPTFTAPATAGNLEFALTVTDDRGLSSAEDTVRITIGDAPPTAIIVGPSTANEGEAVTLDGTTSSDPNDDLITAFVWALSSSLALTLDDPGLPRPSFTVPTFCGAAQATATLIVWAGGQNSAVTTHLIDLQDTINNPPVADAGLDRVLDEGVSVSLDGSLSADCNGDAFTYQWSQLAGPPAPLSDPTLSQPSITTPQVVEDTDLVFQLVVNDGRGLTDTASVTITVRNNLNELPVADPGPAMQVPVTSLVQLNGTATDPNPGDTVFTFVWTQVGGTPMTLSPSNTAQNPTFTAPTTPQVLNFELVVNDTKDDSLPAPLTVTIGTGGPDLTLSTIRAADPFLTADGVQTTQVTVSVRDPGNNPLTGETVVLSTTLGTMAASVIDQGNGDYTQNLMAGTVSGTADLSFTVGGSPSLNTTTVLFLPGPPSGSIVLTSVPAALPADGAGVGTITSDPITDVNGNPILDGSAVTISSTRGTLIAVDIDGGTLGVQIATTAGVITFGLQSETVAATAVVVATTLVGSATGSVIIDFQPGLPAGIFSMQVSNATLPADGVSVTTVTGGPVLDSLGNVVPDGTLVTIVVPNGSCAAGVDVDLVIPGCQVFTTTVGDFSADIVVGTVAGTTTVTATTVVGTASGSVDITLLPGPAAGTITLAAIPPNIVVTGTASPDPDTTTIASLPITDQFGNVIAAGSFATIGSDLGTTILTPDALGAVAGLQVLSIAGVITYDVQSGTVSGVANTNAVSGFATGATPITIDAGPAADIAYISGDAQSGTVDTALASPFVVRVTDIHGNPVPGVTVTWTATGGGGSVGPASTTTDASGNAQATGTLGIVAGSANNTYQAGNAALIGSPVGFTATADPGSPTTLVVGGVPSPISAGSAQSVTVTVLDTYGNIVTGYTGTVTFTSTDGAAVVPVDYTFVLADAGSASVPGLEFRTTGTHSITATDTGAPAVTGEQTGIVVDPGLPDQLAFASQPTNTVATQTIAPPITVQILDPFGNLVGTATNAVTALIGTDPTAGTAVLSGTLSVSAVSGVASFGDLSIQATGVGFDLSATATALISDTSTSFDITVGVATQLAVVVQPTNTIAGVPIAPSIQIEIQDVAGNLDTSATDFVTLAIGTDPSGGSATLGGTLIRAAIGGVATFDDITLDVAAFGYDLDATSGVLTGATTVLFDIAVGPPDRLVIGVQPTNAVAGVAIAPALTVRVQDGFGNLIGGATDSISLAIGTDPSSGAAVLLGTTTQSAVAGVATFADISLEYAATGYDLVATSGVLTSATTAFFDITPDVPDQLAFTVQPSTAAAGVAIVAAIEVSILDQFSNLVGTATDTVTVTINTDPSGRPATLSGTIAVAAVVGVASFTDLNIDAAAVGYDLAAGSGVLTAATSGLFDIVAGVPAVLVYSVQPTDTQETFPITPDIVVNIEDCCSNFVATATNSVTLAIGTNPSAGILSGTTTVAAVAGVATFTAISIDNVGLGYDLVASATGLTSDTSVAFDITPCLVNAVVAASVTNAFPWDTILLSGVGSTDCGRAVTYTWALTLEPAGTAGGFQPYGTFPPFAAGIDVDHYVDEPGTYTYAMLINDGILPHSATVSVNVAGWVLIDYTGATASPDSRDIAIRATDGFVFIGTRGGPRAQVYQPGAPTPVTDLGCLSDNRGYPVGVSPAGRVYFGFDNGRELDELTTISPCAVDTYDPVDVIAGVAGADPTKIRALAFSGENIYAATDKDIFFFDRGADDFTLEYEFTDFGSDWEYMAAEMDQDGNLWFASRANTPNDGAVKTSVPPVAADPRIDYQVGITDAIRFLVRGIKFGTENELWMGTNGEGIYRIQDVALPTVMIRYTDAIDGLGHDTNRDGAVDSTGDVWFANPAGLARYKRDVDAWALLPEGGYGLSVTESYAVVFDEDNGRGRTVYVAAKEGVWRINIP